MGGVGGHMNHLYDDPNLKFSQIKDILSKASSGKLEGTEKTDGQNIFLSYSFKNKEARAARNKGNIQQGGMNAQQLSAKFAGRNSLQAAFDGAFNVWEKTIQALSPRVQKAIFGSDADIWYNAEVQDPGNANVVNYDSKNLVIHQAGHAKYNKNTGKAMSVDVSKSVNALIKAIETTTIVDDEYGFQLRKNAIIQLKALDNDEALTKAFARLEKLLSRVGISDNQTVGDYISVQLDDVIDKHIFDLSPDVKKALINRISGQKGLNINQITKQVSLGQGKKIKILANNSGEIIKRIIFPLESIVHDFTVEMLRDLESVFILDNRKETDRLRKEVEQAIKVIQSSNETNAIKILNQQLKKLKKAENVSTAVEGFVFNYKGSTYKFTGNFAPINQILGLFKFGRDKILPMKHLVKESAKNRVIALVPGGYKPPHVGHYLQAKYFSDTEGIDEVIVIISPKSRFDSTKTIEFTAKESVEAWGVFVKNDPKIKIQVAKNNSPVAAVFDYLESNTNPGDKIILGVSDKEAKESSSRYRNIEKFVKEKRLKVNVEVITTPIIRMSAKDVSATDLREMVSEGRRDDFLAYMPNHLSEEDRLKIWHIMAGNKMNNKGVNNSNVEISEDNLDKEYSLEEISAMGGGGAEGYAGVFGMQAPRKRKKIYKEGDIMDRTEFLKEQKVRHMIRSCIDNLHTEQVKSKIAEEIKVREYIKKQFLKEESDLDKTPHDSTGINVLEDLLKKIIPIIETGYKILTTKKEQRTSYRAHILNAIQKTVTQADITDNAGAIDVVTEEIIDLALETMIDDDIDIKVGDDPTNNEKFIDIDGSMGDNEDKEKENFTLDGEDETGRDMAQQTYDKIETSILDSYAVLSDTEDKKLFYDYLLANTKLYFDKFESELMPALGDPIAGDEAAKNTIDSGSEEDFVPEL